MNDKSIAERPGAPDGMVSRDNRMRSRVWKCDTCGNRVTNPTPITVPVPCARCGGIAFRVEHALSS